MKLIKLPLLPLLFTFTLASCSTAPQLSEQEIIQRYPNVQTLDLAMDEARQNELEVLSPHEFEKANELYKEAIDLAKKGDPKADATAGEALRVIDKANGYATSSRDMLGDVLEARSEARSKDAPSLAAEKYDEAEEMLLELTAMVEEGNSTKAKAGQLKAAQAFSDAELMALKGVTVEQAEAAIAMAKENDADKYAPKTFRRAEDEYNLAVNILEANRNNTEKASVHAKEAVWQAQRASEISEMIRVHKEANYKPEDTVLWYQDQLASVMSPIDQELKFNLPNRTLVSELRAEVSGLIDERDDALAQLESYTQKTQSEIAMSQEERMQQQALDARFNFIQALYTEKEAEVYRQKDDVLIRAYGFAFVPGTSEITTENFALMNKIIESLKQFPNSRIVVSGHTDSTGNDELNQKLSEERAAHVAEFLSQVGNIDTDRIEYVGYGKEKPVASNQTAEGRAQNRRVEILIKNS